MGKLYLGGKKIFDSADIDAQVATKVDKVSGKQLSTEDYTTAEKEKLESLYNYDDSSIKALINTHKEDTTNPHSVTKAQVGLGNLTNDVQVKRSEMGVAGGVATLDSDGLVPSSQLPSYVDDVLEYDTLSQFPEKGESGKIYIALDTNLSYRWGGTTYVVVASDLALGETSATAYPGDKGKSTTDSLNSHLKDTNNPHNVTKSQVGLGNVDNTSDVNKPVSTSQQSALDKKVDKVTGKQLSTEDFSSAYKEKLDGAALIVELTNAEFDALETKDSQTLYVVPATKLAVGDDVIVDNTYIEYMNNKIDNHIADTNVHIPSGGEKGQILMSKEDGSPYWASTYLATSALIDLLSYGIEWDTTLDTPDCTRIGNPLLHRSLPIQSAWKGCIAKDGVVQYYLNADDWAYKEDGTTEAVLDGTDGDVMVDTGLTWYIKSEEDGNMRRVRISTVQIDSTWIEVPRVLIDAYRSTVDTTDSSSPKARSVVNTTAAFRGGSNRSAYDVYLNGSDETEADIFKTDLGKPRTAISRTTMRKYARNNNKYVLSYDFYKWCHYWLPVIEYATFNLQQDFNAELDANGYHQGGLSAGVTNWDGGKWNNYNGSNPLTPCGYTNELGNHTGIKAFTTNGYTSNAIRYRGIENIFGDIWTNLDGVIIQNDADSMNDSGNCVYKNVYTCKDPDKFSDSITSNYQFVAHEINSASYIGEFNLGETAEIIPISLGGGATTKKCDYNYVGDVTNTSLRTLRVGGAARDGSYAGVGYFYSGDSVGYSYAHFGFRTYCPYLE
jgi:hypothetical protein